MVSKGLVDGLAALADKENAFYNCSCGWKGDELAYADEHGKGRTLTCGGRNHRPYKPNQGHCPECGRPFEGCFA